MRVRVIAPLEVRVRRLVAQKGYDEKKAEKTFGKSDRDSAGYISSFFKADMEGKDLYDLILNTRAIPIDTGAELIINTLDTNEFKVSFEETAEKLVDLTLAQKAADIPAGFSGLGWTKMSVEKGGAI